MLDAHLSAFLSSSGEVEYYTPRPIITAAHTLLGSIDLDPASSAAANATVGATRYYTREDNGLSKPWHGRVWLNHPFHAGEEPCKPGCRKKACQPGGKRGHCITERIPSNAEWINKLMREYKAGHVTEALCITYACTSEKWFQPLQGFPRVELAPRTNYLLPDGTLYTGNTKGSVITFLPENHWRVVKFHECFGGMGAIKIPYAWYLQALRRVGR